MDIKKYSDILRSYGRRKGKTLSPAKKQALEEVLELYERRTRYSFNGDRKKWNDLDGNER